MGITRFTNTAKWQDKWYRGLSPFEKVVWEYIRDCCDNAGFLEIDKESISFHTKVPEEKLDEIFEGLKRGYIGAKEGHGDWIWIRNFLKHQRNLPLNPKNNSHNQIINLINEQSKRFDVSKIIDSIGEDSSKFKEPKKERKKKEEKKETPESIIKEDQFEQFWSMYGKRINLKKTKPLFMGLKDKDIVAIFKQLPEYVKSTPDLQYRMAPDVYLRGERWNDEIKHKILSEGGGESHRMHSVMPKPNKND